MRFSEDYSIQAKVARPTLPDELSDRAQDIWEILIIIAACASDEWEKRAKKQRYCYPAEVRNQSARVTNY